MNRFLTAALLALCSVPALADPPAQAPADRPVCTYESSTGSHIRKRVCTTRAQREERAAQDREAAQRLKELPKPLDAAGR